MESKCRRVNLKRYSKIIDKFVKLPLDKKSGPEGESITAAMHLGGDKQLEEYLKDLPEETKVLIEAPHSKGGIPYAEIFKCIRQVLLKAFRERENPIEYPAARI